MIRIVGAGFSGLSLAYYFTKQGVPVEVVEKQQRPGGVIQSHFQNDMLVESAANGFLASAAIETLFHDIGVSPLETKKESRNKFIFRGKMRRWPLSLRESLELMLRLVWAKLTRSLKPAPAETVRSWSGRVLGAGAAEYLIQPMVNGIFAQRAELLNADLVLGSLFYKRKKGSKSGLLSAPNGMGEVMSKMQDYLKNKGVQFLYGTDEIFDIKYLQHNTFLAIDYFSFQNSIPKYSSSKDVTKKNAFRSLSLVRITVNFNSSVDEINGFGVLFPNVEEFNALGVLANTKIFSNRGQYNESWIFSDSTAENLMDFSDEEIIQKIKTDRRRLFSTPFEIKDFVISRWPNVLPDYNLGLRDFLSNNPDLTEKLAGNYLGVLGLTGIHERNGQVVAGFLAKSKERGQ